jgi:hypothetical protein
LVGFFPGHIGISIDSFSVLLTGPVPAARNNKNNSMSQAFVKEEDDQWLHEIPATLTALINYLTRENNGIRVYQKNTLVKDGREVYDMSNGLQYAKDAHGKWEIV